MHGTTSLQIRSLGGHVHQISGITSFDDGHTHRFDVFSGPPLRPRTRAQANEPGQSLRQARDGNSAAQAATPPFSQNRAHPLRDNSHGFLPETPGLLHQAFLFFDRLDGKTPLFIIGTLISTFSSTAYRAASARYAATPASLMAMVFPMGASHTSSKPTHALATLAGVSVDSLSACCSTLPDAVFFLSALREPVCLHELAKLADIFLNQGFKRGHKPEGFVPERCDLLFHIPVLLLADSRLPTMAAIEAANAAAIDTLPPPGWGEEPLPEVCQISSCQKAGPNRSPLSMLDAVPKLTRLQLHLLQFDCLEQIVLQKGGGEASDATRNRGNRSCKL